MTIELKKKHNPHRKYPMPNFHIDSKGHCVVPYGIKTIGTIAFCNCSELRSIEIPNSVTQIKDSAFNCSGLTSIKIPNSVIQIEYSAFSGCNGLTSIEIPDSVVQIGNRAFSGCSGLTSIKVSSGNEFFKSEGNCILSKDGKTLWSGIPISIIPDSVTQIGDEAFADCSGLTSVKIPNSVIQIGDGAFLGCSGLTSVKIPNGVIQIGNRAFLGCSGLISIKIPNSVTQIGDKAFYKCSSLTSIEIPDSITHIGNDVIWRCSNLSSIIFHYKNPDDTLLIIRDITSLKEIHVPVGTGQAYRHHKGFARFKKIIEDVK